MAGLRTAIAQENEPQKKPTSTPKGFKSDADFLDDMRQKYDFGYGYNEHNVVAGRDDAKFVVGKQWDPVIEQERKTKRKPTLTFNRLVAFLAQLVGDRLMNETEIRVLPDKGGTKEIASIRESIIRMIFKSSHANFARDEAYKYQVIGGQGAYTLRIDYANDDVFEQDIIIDAITDPYAAIFDPLGIEPSGGDCEWAFVGEDIPQQEYKKRWPWATETSFMDENRWNKSGFWMSQDTIRIVSYWRMVTEGHKTLALYMDGTVHDVSDKEEYEYLPFTATRADGSLYTRVVPKRFARLYVCSGNEILEGPFDYPCSSIPVYRVPGWEVNDGERTHRWGLIRFLKDPQRLHNYWRSTIAEQLVSAPRNKWMTTPDAIKGHQAKWRNAAISDDPFLYYNDGEQPPVHIPPPGMDAALIAEAGSSTQDLKDISNIHEAALGMPSNEVSGVAIQNRQMVTDVGTYIYQDRMRIADERCATNCNELIPEIFDTQRLIMVMGTGDKMSQMVINDPSDPNSDVTIGKYNLTVSIGPASITKRTRAAEAMMAFVNAAPEVAANVMDLVAEAQDWPESDEFARRFKLMLPPGMIPQDEMTPDMIQMQQAAQQKGQQAEQLAMAQAQVEMSLKGQKAAEAEARAHLSIAQAYKAIQDANARTTDVAGKNKERGIKNALGILDQHNSSLDADHAEHMDTTHHLPVDAASTAAAIGLQASQTRLNDANAVKAAQEPQETPDDGTGEPQ